MEELKEAADYVTDAVDSDGIRKCLCIWADPVIRVCGITFMKIYREGNK